VGFTFSKEEFHMAEEQVFRFMALRQAEEKTKKERLTSRRVYYSVTGKEPPLAQEIFKLPLSERTPAVIKRLAQAFQSSARYVKDVSALPFETSLLANWLEEYALKQLNDLDLAGFFQEAYQKSPAEVVKSREFSETALRLAETLFADALGDHNHTRQRDNIVHSIKLLHLINAAVEEAKLFESDETLGAFFASMLVTIPELEQPLPEIKEPTVTPGKRETAEDERSKALKDRLEKLTEAHTELTRILSRPAALAAARSKIELPTGSVDAADNRIGMLEANVARLLLQQEKPDDLKRFVNAAALPSIPAAEAGIVDASPKISLSTRLTGQLTQTTKTALSDLNIDMRNANPFAAVNTIETEIAQLAAQLPIIEEPRTVLALGGVLLDTYRLAESLGIHAGKIDFSTLPPVQPCQFKAGIGDLLIVRQKLKAYELGDFAHVENVLMGESREREHRRLSLREDITVVETEKETEKERNLQSTERNEMQNEANKVVQSQFQLDAGLQVSGSYGPAVSFSASLNTSFSTSTQESQRKAVSYSREVTDKTTERIRERVREERRRRVLEQVEEINIHKIQNNQNPTGHVRGIYRWLNKIYDAQIFNYGQRMMYEFTIPEPAAYFLYAMIENPPQDMELEKPTPPAYPINGAVSLKPENLTRSNYQQYLAKYEVTNAKAPPSSFKNMAYFDKQEGMEESNHRRASKISIPDGYEATSAVVWHRWWRYDNRADRANLRVAVGGYDATSGWVQFGSPFREEVSVGISTSYVAAFVVTVDVYCRLTAEGFAKWQHDTYAAIMEAYLNKKAIYEEKLAQMAIQKGVQVLGRNPYENRRIEREELKKLVAMTLMKNSYLSINSFYGGAEPVMNITKACENGSKIRFFENAFEWNNMTYVFYPYFWGRRARWISALHLTDPDHDFAAFLRAGAARVQVPVRPGFERAVAYFCQVGEIWEGNDVPLIGDDLYVPIVEEISENLGKLDLGIPYPEGSQPWEVTVPTSLVIVQNLEEIPQIRDILTGNPIQLLPDDNS
jgi:hypothetical protein